MPIAIGLNTTDVVSFNNNETHPTFFSAQNESVILQFFLKPTLGTTVVYSAEGQAMDTYISFTKIKIQIELDMSMSFNNAAVTIKEVSPDEYAKNSEVDYTCKFTHSL